jgi:sensor histidine kinase regulating citrate/malate metabolism
VATIRKDVVQYIAEYIGNVLGNSSGLKFQIENKETSFMMQFKPLEMAMVLDNFISNSKKAKANLVVISFEKKGKSLHIHIADDGSGISKEVARNLFKRGYTTTTGAGIGLYHIRSMVDGMGGSVDFVGNNYNKTARGACFEMVFR